MKNLFLRVTMTLALLAGCMSAFAQSTVKGTVKDAAGEPVIGAAVQVAGTHNGTITELDGSFALSGVQQGDKLEVSCIGYAGQTITWNGGVVNVVLQEDAEMLEGTVVTALGIRKDEKKVGYAVSSVSAESLNATVAPSLGSALYGKASGVRISTAQGATGSISINVRGLSSITGTNQPLVVVDGIPVRNGEANNEHFWSDNYIQSNGLTDINVEDIENLTILKGASATSLYGSEGANGVVLITMKKGKKNSGVHVDFNASIQGDFVAYMPVYQTTYGPGARHRAWAGNGYTEEGFVERTDRNGNTVLGVPSASAYFGPKYDGRQVYHYDGTMHSYNAYSAHPWNDVFRTGLTQQYNLAVTAGHERGNMRFSYTFMDNLPNQYNSHTGKHNFSLTGSQDITSNGKVKLGYSVNYLKENIKNRPFKTYDVVCSFSGMFGAFDNMAWVREHSVTSAGYRNRVYTEATHENPSEGFAYDLPFGNIVGGYFWKIFGQEQYEDYNRLIASVSPSWEIIKGLTLKGNIATDYTGQKTEMFQHTETANGFGSYSGSYQLSNRTYQTIYGDALLNFNRNITDKFAIDVNLGYSARSESMIRNRSWTVDGLTVENWFHLNASSKTPETSMEKTEFLKQAIFGTVSLSYGDWAYLEGTIRNETVSTLYPGKNSFWYPSVNASIIFSELFNMPSWVDYAKLRASYGVVGNAPELYKAPMSYTQNTASGYIYNIVSSSLGNDGIRPETTYEFEVGLEGKFLKNRAGFELSYYNKRIVDQILEATAPRSTGGGSILMNVGELSNQGVEFSAYGSVVENRDWRLNLSGNVAWNTNKVVKLADGMDVIEHLNMDNSGAAFLRSYVGQKMGDIYAYGLKVDENGNHIVDDDPNSETYGFQLRTDEMVKVGNAMPDLIGGFAISLGYKRFTLDANFNFQIGGHVLNVPYEYMMGRGSLVESMKYRDAEHGGLSYYLNGNVLVPTSASAGPNGERVYHDGMILDGVRASDGKPNDVMIDSETWYNWSYNWGTDAPTWYGNAVFKNTYLKCREIALRYTLPENITRKFRCNNLTLSLFARNPFFVYKNMPIFDVEASDATNWIRQSVIQGSSVSTRTFGFSLRANF